MEGEAGRGAAGPGRRGSARLGRAWMGADLKGRHSKPRQAEGWNGWERQASNGWAKAGKVSSGIAGTTGETKWT